MATLDLEPRTGRIPEEAYLYVIERIAEGCSIRKAAVRATEAGFTSVPSAPNVIAWAHSSPKRLELYRLAKRTAAEIGATEVSEIADDALDGVGDDPGVMNARIAHARLKSDNRKWIAAKLLPDDYGDRIAHEHSGNVTISLDTGIRRIDGPIIDASIRTASLLDDAPTSLLADASDASESIAPMVRAVSLLD